MRAIQIRIAQQRKRRRDDDSYTRQPERDKILFKSKIYSSKDMAGYLALNRSGQKMRGSECCHGDMISAR